MSFVLGIAHTQDGPSSLFRFFKNPLKIFKKGLDPVNMMQTVVNLMRTMKAFGYDVEEELFKDRKKFKHKIKGYRSLDDFDDLDDLINMLGISEERFGNPSAIMNLNVTAESRSDILRQYFSVPGGESYSKNDSGVIDKVLFEVGAPVNNETVSEETSGKSDSRDESDRRRRRSADEEDDLAGRDTVVDDPNSLIAAKLLRDAPDMHCAFISSN